MDRLPKTRKAAKGFFNGVADLLEAAAEASRVEREKNEKIEEAVTALMEEYTGSRLVLVDKED